MRTEVKPASEESASGVMVSTRLSRKCLFIHSWFLCHLNVTFAPIKRSGKPSLRTPDSAGLQGSLWRLTFVSHRHTNLLPFYTFSESSGMRQGLIDTECLSLLPETEERWRRMKMRASFSIKTASPLQEVQRKDPNQRTAAMPEPLFLLVKRNKPQRHQLRIGVSQHSCLH